jgi:exonuclease III
VAEEVSEYKLDIVGVQEVRWDRGSTEPAGKYKFLYGKGNENHESGTGFFFVRKRIRSSVKRVEFYSDRMSYIILRGRRYDIIDLNVHVTTEDKIYVMKDSFYEELERVLHKFPKYHMKMLGDFNAKVGREDIFKPTVGNRACTKLIMIME